MKPFSLTLILILLAAGCVNVERIRLQAGEGDAAAQYRLGRMYERGESVHRDFREAMKWYQRAADQGFPQAQNSLGWFYREGQGVEQDFGAALKWYRKAAEQGWPMAQLNLGWMYERGMGVEKDDAVAATWYRRAAERGLSEAQLDLGVMYWRGNGVEKDPVEAYKWLTLARQSPDNEMAVHRAVLALDKMEGSLSEAEKARGRALVEAFVPVPPGLPAPSGRIERNPGAE
jgi:TPR repeat protein